MPRLTETLARRAVERSVAERQAEYAEEMERIVEATYALVERTGGVDPPLRDILNEAALSTQAFYRYFRSKDELMLAVLDDGCRRLVEYLAHRMASTDTPAAAIRAWVEGVMVQGASETAAARTRPFLANEDRLAEMFPEEHRASIDQLLALLRPPLQGLRRGDVDRDAEAVYRLTFATLHAHLIARSRPSEGATNHLVTFILAALTGTAGATKAVR